MYYSRTKMTKKDYIDRVKDLIRSIYHSRFQVKKCAGSCVIKLLVLDSKNGLYFRQNVQGPLWQTKFIKKN